MLRSTWNDACFHHLVGTVLKDHSVFLKASDAQQPEFEEDMMMGRLIMYMFNKNYSVITVVLSSHRNG